LAEHWKTRLYNDPWAPQILDTLNTMNRSIVPVSALLLALAFVQHALAATSDLTQSYCSTENTGSDGDASK
jgi:hypothetical protein